MAFRTPDIIVSVEWQAAPADAASNRSTRWSMSCAKMPRKEMDNVFGRRGHTPGGRTQLSQAPFRLWKALLRLCC